jgi:hypothetical protein
MRTNVAFTPTVTDRRHCSVTPALPIAQSSFLRTSQHYPKELMHRVRTSSCFQWRDAVSTTTGSVTRCYATFGQTPEPNGVSLPHAVGTTGAHSPTPCLGHRSFPHLFVLVRNHTATPTTRDKTKPRSERPQ